MEMKKVVEFVLVVVTFSAVSATTTRRITEITPREGGQGGGLRLTIKGSGFSADQYNAGTGNEDKGNHVTLVNKEDSQDAIECDTHKDGSTETQIMCYTREGMKANAQYMAKVKVDGENVPDCTGHLCLFTVREYYTPKFDSITPQSGKAGDTIITMHGRIFTTLFMSTETRSTNGVDKKILRAFGPQTCNLFQSTDVYYQLELDSPTSMHGTIQCKPEGSFVGNANPTVLIEQPYGRSLPYMTLYRISRKGIKYTIQYYTDVQSISPAEGSTNGGVNITVRGDYYETAGKLSTYSDAEVYIGDQVCPIVHVEKNQEIMCTAPAMPDPQPSFYCGGRGVLVETWDVPFTSYDDAFANTDTPDSIDWFDETRYCGTITNKLTRMTGVFHVPYDGHYQFFIKGNGKLVVEIDGVESGIESTGNWVGTGHKELVEGDMIKLVAVGKPTQSSDACVTVRAIHKNTTFTPKDTGMAYSELQSIILTSTVENQNYTLKFQDFASTTAVHEKQTLCVTDSSNTFKLGLFGVYTATIDSVLVTADVKKGLDNLPVLVSGESFTVETNTNNPSCIDITFQSNRGDIPMITTLPDTGATVSEVTQGLSNNMDFAFNFNGVSSPLLTYDTADKPGFADTIKESLEGMFSVRCPAMYSTGGNFHESFEEGPDKFGSKVSAEEEAFCGRYTCKNCARLFPISGRSETSISLLFKWACFAVKGHDNTLIFMRFKDREGNIMQGWFNVLTDMHTDGDWTYKCVDTKAEADGRWSSNVLTELIEMRIFNYNGDYHVDEIHFAQTKAIGEIDDIEHLRLAPATPNVAANATVKSVSVEYDDVNDEYLVSIAPYGCLHDFDLLTLSGSDINGEYSSTATSVTSTLKVSSGSAGTLEVTVTNKASKPIQGTIKVSYLGNSSGDIDVQMEDNDFKDMLEGIEGMTTLRVKRTAASTCANMEIDVEFVDSPGDKEKMTALASFTSDNDPALDIIEKRNGHLSLDPIPGDMVYTHHSTPQVRVVINDIPTKCVMTNNECSFSYSSSATPTITGIDITQGNQNDVLIITGTLFSTTNTDNLVSIGGVPCEVTGSTTTEIVCTVGNGPLGEFPVNVAVVGKGVATGTVTFTYTAGVTNISPLTSTIGGNVILTVSGKGLSEDSVVTIGTQECIKTGAEIPTKYFCTVPAYSDLTVVSQQTVTVSVRIGTVDLTPTYNFVYTVINAQISSVTTDEDLTVHGGQTITIQGSNMGNAGQVFIEDVELTVNSRTDTEIIVVTPTPTPPGIGRKLLVYFGTDGVILQSSAIPTVDIRLAVTNMYPTEGSLFGGTPVILTGMGFGELSPSVKVMIGDYECEVTGLTNTEIKCIIEDTAQTHEITNNGDHGLKYPYAFSEKTKTVMQGDFVRWSWTTPEFVTAYHGIAETGSLTATEDKLGGISSGTKSRDGSFIERMTKLGMTYFWSGYVDAPTNAIYYRMTVNVLERTETKKSLRVFVAEQEASYDLNSGQSDPPADPSCNLATADINDCVPDTIADPDETKFSFHFTKCRSPVVSSVDFEAADNTIGRSALTTTVLQFSGSGLSDEDCANIAKIGDCECTVSDSTPSAFNCTPDASCEYNVGIYQPLTLSVNQYGHALIDIQSALDRSVAFLPLIQSILPTSGSSKGDTVITITGSGFSEDSDAVIVTFDDVAASCSITTKTSLTCTTPTQVEAGSAAVEVNINKVPAKCESDCTFQYDTSITPALTSVMPTSVSTTATLTIGGTLFGTEADKISITIGGEVCSNIIVTSADTEVTCSIDAIPAGENDVALIIEDVGRAASDPNVNVIGEAIATVAPTIGSIHGHTLLTFTGHGFVDGLSILVDGDDICETVTVNSLTQVECITLPHALSSTSMVIVSSGVTYDAVTFEFSDAATPSVTSVSPATGAAGDTITIQGQKLGTVADDIKVYIGSVECTGVSMSGTDVSCTAGPQASGAYDVIVDVSGKGRSQSGVTFTYTVTLTSLNPSTGDSLGNQLLELIGNGFRDTQQVTVCDNECTFHSLPSSSSYKCITPSGTGACDVKIIDGQTTITSATQYTYQADSAPTITSISPSRGGTGGNTEITISGSRFSETSSDISVTIADVPCAVSVSTTSQIKCNTGSHQGSKMSDVVVTVNDIRATSADASVLSFHYIDVWSSSFTWGGQAPPGKDEFVVIPENQVVLFDADTDVMEMLIIQGQLIFDEVDGLTLRARRILITNGGKLQIGSAEKPFPADKTAIIELYGHQRDQELPIYGTKFLGVRNGTLDLYGSPIENTWTMLASTAAAGATTITLQGSLNGWKVGDEIFIATTGPKDSTNENEKRTITGIDGNVLTLNEALQFEHLGNSETYTGPGGAQVVFDYRAEVGLLSRNIIVRGNSEEQWEVDIEACDAGFNSGEFVTQTCFEGRFGEEKGSSEFGAQILIHQAVKDTQEAQAHLSYVEVTFAGQAFRLGRYPVHFHLNGNMSESFVRGCGIHNTFNRAVNVHGSHNILLEENVAYDVMGGAFFLEDGVETGNKYIGNLGVYVKSSTSLLNDDITPAIYWITNPDNIFIGNHAAGGTHFGFWYRMHEHPDGPSFTNTICPRKVPIRSFQNNSAHSFGWFGLWMFAEYYPSKGGSCGSTVAAPAVIQGFRSWNNQKGIEFVTFGSMQIIDSVFAQNELAGFEGKMTSNAPARDYLLSPTVNNTLFVGQADSESNRNAKGVTKAGFIWPYGYAMAAHNLKFHNFDTSTVAFKWTSIDGTCSDKCGGYSNQISGLEFSNTPWRIHYRWEHEAIVEDLDGSLCGLGAKNILPYTNNLPTDCTKTCADHVFPSGFEAAVCPTDTRFHRFAFNNPSPSSVIGKTFVVENRHGSSSSSFMTHRLTHKDGWTVVLEDGETHTFYFQDAEEMTNVSFTGTFEDFHEGDCIVFKLRVSKKPDEVSTDGGISTPIDSSDPITCATPNLMTGNWSYADGEVSVAIVGQATSGSDTSSHNVHFRALKCLFPLCQKPADPETAAPPTQRPEPHQLWEDNIWELDTENNVMKASLYDGSGSGPPANGKNVTIEQGLWVLIQKSSYSNIQVDTLIIKGGLEIGFEGETEFELKANFIIILGGRLHVGWQNNPMLGSVNIILTGSESTPWYKDLDGYEIGNKAIAVFGGLEMHGRDIGTSWVMLKTTVSVGDTTLTVDDGTQISNWRQNDRIVIMSTSNNPAETEEAVIQAIDADLGTITLKSPLQYRHTGGVETVNGNDINVKAAIGVLNRSIKIDGGELAEGDTAYGGRVLVSVSLDGTELRTGYARLSNVMFTRLGQDGFTDVYDPRFALAYVDTGSITDVKPSEVTNCAFVDLYNSAIGVIGLSDLEVNGNIVYKPLGHGIVTTSENTLVEGNLISRVQFTGTYDGRFEAENFLFQAGLEAIKAIGLQLRNNYIAGSERIGYHVPGENCDSTESQYSNNYAFGNLYGVTILPDDDLSTAGITTCSRLSGFTMYKNIDYGMYFSNEMSFEASGNNFIEENVALFPMVIGPDPLTHTCGGKSVVVKDSVVVGTSSLSDCSVETSPSGSYYTHNSKNLRSKRGPNEERLGLEFAGFFGGTNSCGEKPCWSHMAYNSICGKMSITGVTFKSFNGERSGCSAAFAISTMKGNDDLAHPIRATGNDVIDVVDAYKILLHRPNLGKINPADCVDMDCDAMKKAIFKDLDGSFMGAVGTVIPESEWEWDGDRRRGLGDSRVPKDALTTVTGEVLTVNDIAPNGKGIVRTGACTKRTISQGGAAYYWCPGLQHEMLLIESLDDDTELRRLSPVAILSDGYIDLINGPQDHGWCNGYTCQKRISTFHALVLPRETTERYVNVYFSSTQPDEIRFALLDAGSKCVVVGMYYLNPYRIDVYVDDSYVLPNNADSDKWENSKTFVLKKEEGVSYKPTCDEANGANYIDKDERILYFTIKGGTDISNAIKLQRADVVIVSFGFPAISKDDFFNDDTIIQNLANFLGVALNKIRVVDIIEESSGRKKRSADTGVTVIFEVGQQPEEETDEPITDYASDLMDACQEGTMSGTLGVSGTSCEEIIVEESVYTPVQPDELWFYETVSSKHEGVPFPVQPKIRAYDTNGEIVAHLGIEESPWEITATLRTCDPTCGHPSAQLDGTLTISSSNGWFNFTDLSISHKGEGYIIDFEVSSPYGTNLTLETLPFSVDGLPMTAGIHSMTSDTIMQDATFSMTLDLRDSSTNTPLPDVNWRGHTAFDATCDLAAVSSTGNLTGTLSTTYDMATGRAMFDDLAFSGYGIFYISCLVVSTPVEYEFYSVHKVFVLGSHQANIVSEATNTIVVKFNLDFKTTLPTEVAEAQLEQATMEVFTTRWPMVIIRESSISEGSIIVTFTIEGGSPNVTEVTKDMCDALSSGLKVAVGSSTLTLEGFMTVDGEDYYATCGRKKEEEEGLHPAIIALIVILCLLLIGVIVFLLIWCCIIRPKSKTHGMKEDGDNEQTRTVMYPGGFYYLDNGKMVFLAGPNQKLKGSESVGIQAASKPPLTTLYDETKGGFAIRKSPQPPNNEMESGSLTPAGL